MIKHRKNKNECNPTKKSLRLQTNTPIHQKHQYIKTQFPLQKKSARTFIPGECAYISQYIRETPTYDTRGNRRKGKKTTPHLLPPGHPAATARMLSPHQQPAAEARSVRSFSGRGPAEGFLQINIYIHTRSRDGLNVLEYKYVQVFTDFQHLELRMRNFGRSRRRTAPPSR